MLFRSLTVGLLGTCLYAVLQLSAAFGDDEPSHLQCETPMATAPDVTVVDVASGVPSTKLVELLHLGPGEHVVAVDDNAVVSDLAAGAMIATRLPRSGQFVDLTVQGARGEGRRLLVLLH